MSLRRVACGGLLLASIVGGDTWAQTLPPLNLPLEPPHKAAAQAHHKGVAHHAADPRSVEQTAHDLLRGSAAQQELERSDAEAAGLRPIDHSKDEFGSEIHGQ